MNRHKKFLFVYFGTLLLMLPVLPAVNIYIDSSRALTRDYATHYKTTQGNINFLKMSYLLKHREAYDSLIFGSSRVRYGFDPRKMNEVMGGKWYKMEYPGGVPEDHLYNLETLLIKGFKPKQVILTLDDFDLYKFGSREHDYFYRPYPRNIREWFDFYSFYLFKKPTSIDEELILEDIEMKETERIVEPFGFLLEERLTAHKKRMLKLPPKGWKYSFLREADAERLLNDIGKIIQICKEHDIKLNIMFTPRYYKTLYAHDFAALAAFKKQLAALHPYVDFSVLDKYTVEHQYWSDTSHFYTNVGQLVIKALINPSDRAGGFGTLVDRTNVDMHITRAFDKAKQLLPGLMASDHKMIVHPSFMTWKKSVAITDRQDVVVKNKGDETLLITKGTTPQVTFKCQSDCVKSRAVVNLQLKGYGGALIYYATKDGKSWFQKGKLTPKQQLTYISLLLEKDEAMHGVRIQFKPNKRCKILSMAMGGLD